MNNRAADANAPAEQLPYVAHLVRTKHNHWIAIKRTDLMLTPLFTHARVAILSGLRAHSFRALFALGCALIGSAYLAASFSGREPMIIALDVGLSALKLIGTLLALFWVQDLVARDIDRKNLLWVLAYPVPRHSYLLGRFLGIVILLLLALIVLGGMLGLVVSQSSMGYQAGQPINLGLPLAEAIALIALDITLVLAFCLMITSFSTSSLLPLAMGACFAIASRSLGGVLAFLASAESQQINPALRDAILRFQWAIPDLSRLDIRDHVLYGASLTSSGLHIVIPQVLCYILICLLIACLSLSRREII